ncbi:hypothetical protein [Roseospira navarrensis]|nr:hypothetical protein [Roseospira navarrensis]
MKDIIPQNTMKSKWEMFFQFASAFVLKKDPTGQLDLSFLSVFSPTAPH